MLPPPAPPGAVSPAADSGAPGDDVWVEEGVAAWYGAPFHGRPTASGETYDMFAMTAAHRTLPFGTVLDVLNLDNGLSTSVRINDRGPFIEGRNLDLSRRAAQELEMLGPGLARVRLQLAGSTPPLAGNPPPLAGSAPPPAVHTPAASSVCWMVHVAQYPDVEDAELVRRSLERDGHGPVGVTTGIRGLYRVRVGPLDSRAGAEELSRRVAGMVLNCAGLNF